MEHLVRRRLAAWALAFILAATLAVSDLGRAQSGGGYDLSWWTAPGGGGTSSGTGYSLSGAAGQAAAGELGGSGYHLSGGYWVGVAVPWRMLYLPLVTR